MVRSVRHSLKWIDDPPTQQLPPRLKIFTVEYACSRALGSHDDQRIPKDTVEAIDKSTARRTDLKSVTVTGSCRDSIDITKYRFGEHRPFTFARQRHVLRHLCARAPRAIEHELTQKILCNRRAPGIVSRNGLDKDIC